MILRYWKSCEAWSVPIWVPIFGKQQIWASWKLFNCAKHFSVVRVFATNSKHDAFIVAACNTVVSSISALCSSVRRVCVCVSPSTGGLREVKETIEEDDGRRGRPLTEVRDGLIRIRSCTRRNATDGAAVRRREGDEADRSLLAVSSERPQHAAIHRLRFVDFCLFCH